MHRFVTVVVVATTAALVQSTALAAPAALSPVKRSLTSSTTTARVCHARPATGRGIARTTYRAPMSGFITTRGSARRGNWDLAIFDARTKRAMTSSESFGSNEVAQTWVSSGQRLIVQGCHKSGPASAFQVSTTFIDAAPPKPEVPSLVRVRTTDQGILARLDSLGFDVTENQHANFVDVVAPTADKLALLKESGLRFDVLSSDLRKDFLKARAADAQHVEAPGGSALPTGREDYRTYADYQTELAKLVTDNAGLVRPLTLGKSYQGRDVQGVEIADKVGANDDGRPYFLLVALHHAREWPSAETAMEFAHLLVDGYRSKNKQITELLRKERVVIVPIINPDGFNASRGTDPDPADTLLASGLGVGENYDKLLDALGQDGRPLGVDPYDWDTVEGVFVPFGGNLAYRRKNCDMGLAQGDPAHSDAEQNLPCYYRSGVDPNRNYGYGWGGLGASTDPNSQAYRGTDQWSEPETQNVWHWSQAHNVSMLITLHNVAALVLRPPGQHTDGLAPDEARMKQLGDEMADATGYTSQYGWQLYDTTGTTEDWTYGAQGAFGYTIEIGPEGGMFHMPYQTGVVDQWTGTGARKGRGMREALLLAAQSAANPGDHSVVKGSAQPGATLKLSKNFDTLSSPVCTFAQGVFNSTPGTPWEPLNCFAPGDQRSKPDSLNYTTVVPPSGKYEWHVPPSTRPFVFRHVTPGEVQDTPYDTQSWDAQPSDIKPDGEYTTRTFDVTEEGTNITLDLSWTGPQDYDLELYRVVNGKEEEVDSSGNPPPLPESVTVTNAPTGTYVAHIIYFTTAADTVDATNNWTLALSRFRKGPDTVTTGRENYTLTESKPDGTVIDTRQVYVERGQRVTVDLAKAKGK